jgi:hypothetical protein
MIFYLLVCVNQRDLCEKKTKISRRPSCRPFSAEAATRRRSRLVSLNYADKAK